MNLERDRIPFFENRDRAVQYRRMSQRLVQFDWGKLALRCWSSLAKRPRTLCQWAFVVDLALLLQGDIDCWAVGRQGSELSCLPDATALDDVRGENLAS